MSGVPEENRPDGQGVLRCALSFALGMSLTWIAIETVLLPVPLTAARILVFSAAAVLTGTGAGLAAFLLMTFGRLLWRSSGSVPVLPVVIVLAGLLLPSWVSLFEGAWVSQQWWRPLACWGGAAFGILVLYWLAVRWLRVLRQERRLPHLLGVCLIAAAILAVAADQHPWLARKYLAIHDMLMVLALMSGSLALVVLLSSRKLVLIKRVWPVLVVLALLPTVVTWSPGQRSLLREALWRDGRLTARLMLLLPLRHTEEGYSVDQELLAALRERHPLAKETLDALLPGRRGRDFVMITVDTLRHDALGVMGGRALTPHLDALVRRGFQFSEAWSQFPSTRFAMSSLFTGRYPTTLGFKVQDEELLKRPRFTDVFRDAGYHTLAFTSFPGALYRTEGDLLSRGFETFHNDADDRLRRSERVVDRALKALRERPGDKRPVFLWVHLFDPHGPFTDRGGLRDEASLRQRYDKEVEYADTCLGRLLDALPGGDDAPLILLHSDHGEEFQDHGGVGHNSSLYEEQIRVPLVFAGPGIPAGSSSHPVELLDVGATLMELLDLHHPFRDTNDGRSLVPILLGRSKSRWPVPLAFSQFRFEQFVNGNLDAVRFDNWKLIHDRDRQLFELYDLRADPREKKNLSLEETDRLERMKVVLATVRFLAGAPRGGAHARGEDRTFLQRVAGDGLSEGDRQRFLKILRREVLPDAGVLPDLLDHPQEEVRLRALLHLACYGEEAGLRHLRLRLKDPRAPHQLEARVALAAWGDRISLEDIPLRHPRFGGTRRVLLWIARFAAGDAGLGSVLHQVFAGPFGDEDVETLMIHVFMRRRDEGFLPILYGRLSMGELTAQQVRAAILVEKRFPPELAFPVLRRILGSPDQGLRRAAEAVLGRSIRFGPWKVMARRAEDRAMKAKHLFNGKPDVVVRCLGLLREAMEIMALAKCLDYGYALDLSFVANSWAGRHKLPGLLEKALKDFGDPRAENSRCIQRLLTVAETSRKRFKGQMELLEGERFLEGEEGLVYFLVRVTLEKDSAALVGGYVWETEFLGSQMFDDQRRALNTPLGLALPVTGVMPGESMILAVPVDRLTTLKERVTLGIRLGRGQRDILPPLVLTVSP